MTDYLPPENTTAPATSTAVPHSREAEEKRTRQAAERFRPDAEITHEVEADGDVRRTEKMAGDIGGRQRHHDDQAPAMGKGWSLARAHGRVLAAYSWMLQAIPRPTVSGPAGEFKDGTHVRCAWRYTPDRAPRPIADTLRGSVHHLCGFVPIAHACKEARTGTLAPVRCRGGCSSLLCCSA